MRSENPNRLRAKELISLFPGIHLRGLSRLMGLGQSSTRYHLARLERDGKITCSREGEYLRAYPSSMREEDERRLHTLLQHGPARRVLKALMAASDNGRGLTNDELSRVTRLSRSVASKYVGSFRGLGLVGKVVTKEGRPVLKIEDLERKRISLTLANLERNLFTVTTDRFVDLWNF